jgi:hypothetical protein
MFLSPSVRAGDAPMVVRETSQSVFITVTITIITLITLQPPAC